jgi:2-polyprenyl-3-methyl-5-hydroxy-6-metoxy-1,4-benzoquinol methylase
MIENLSKKLSLLIANSFVLSYGKKLWGENINNWEMPLNKFQKLIIGVYIILLDYGQGKFPPKFMDKELANEYEINYHKSIPGYNDASFYDLEMRKPFWNGFVLKRYLNDFSYIVKIIEEIGISKRDTKLLELGCGTGWMDEFFAISGYNIVGTSIAPFQIEMAKKRIDSLKTKGIAFNMDFFISEMERLDQKLTKDIKYDFVFVYEALHHAFSWKETIQSVYNVLKDDGWFFICNEPNLIHTYVAYRATKQIKIHEIGLSRKQILKHMKKCKFRNIRVTKNKINNFISPHWILAQKGS